jgi:hypothetical protein
MSASYWYETTETHISADGVLTVINMSAETRERLAKEDGVQEWLDRADERGEWPVIVTRGAVEKMLAGVDAKAVTAAKLDAATLDVAAPLSGTAEAKEAAVATKRATVLSVAEWTKLEALRATVVQEELQRAAF